jgi:hypothetical protein
VDDWREMGGKEGREGKKKKKEGKGGDTYGVRTVATF